MSSDVIDLNEALERVEDDIGLVCELLDVFSEDFPVKMAAMKQAVANSNFEELRNVAHSMKGAAGNISAKKMYGIFLRIEEMAEDNNVNGPDELFKELDEQFSQLQAYASELKEKLKD